MPHIAITMYPGRSREIKEALAKRMQAVLAEELKVDEAHVSVSIEDIEKERWSEEFSKIPKNTLFIHKDL